MDAAAQLISIALRENAVSSIPEPAHWKVNLTVRIAGPIRPRTKHKLHKVVSAEATITLPFVPYPGLYLTFSSPRKRGLPLTLYLRVRTVEWLINENRFECVADEILASPLFFEADEVRGPARIEKHFVELQKTLCTFGFDVAPDSYQSLALHKCADGTVTDPTE